VSNLISLRKSAEHWHFENEANFEMFVRSHLLTLFGLSILKQQYTVEGQVCDLLAVNANQQLTIPELKNVEDRYLVQQITRYFDAMQRIQPFPDQVDYSQPIRLIAIAPAFHRDNQIDHQYNYLDIEFWQFKVLERANQIYLRLSNLDTQQQVQVKIPYEERTEAVNIPNPPKSFLNLIAPCCTSEQHSFLQSRDRFLRFDTRMQETVRSGSVMYGKSKSKPCAEFRWDRSRACVVLYLWLPHVLSGSQTRQGVARMRIWTDWQMVSDLGHVPQGNGRKISVSEWQAGKIRPLSKLLPAKAENRQRFFNSPQYRREYIGQYHNIGANPHYRAGLALRFENYAKWIDQPKLHPSLEGVVQLALETWLQRLSK
jgi:RecB family endonuclease NucS